MNDKIEVRWGLESGSGHTAVSALGEPTGFMYVAWGKGDNLQLSFGNLISGASIPFFINANVSIYIYKTT